MKQCVTCVEGKLTRKSFPFKASNRSKRVLDLVHTDVCGPMRTQTVSGKRYFLTFTDDYSRMTKVYLLRTKDEVSLKLKEYIMEVWNEFKIYPKILTTDNGTEYTENAVKNFLKQKGIKFQSTVPYNPDRCFGTEK